MSTAGNWDEEHDVVVIGSGAGGMTAALLASGRGLSSVVLEKADLYGGTSAVSGGGIWVPCNEQIAQLGGSDSFEEAMTYMKHLTAGEVPEERIEAYLRTAPRMVRELARDYDVHFRAVARYPDYFPDEPGGKPGFRTMEPVEFDAALLGEEFERLRPPYAGTLVMARMAMNQVEAHTLFTRERGWVRVLARIMLRYWSDFAWRRRTPRDRRLTLGQSMIAQLRHALARHNVPLRLGTALTALVEENGEVTGVVAEQAGGPLRIRARRGVVLASGGFESNQAMRERYLPQPTSATWTAAPGCNEGDGIRAALELGADLGFMHLTWGTPTVRMSQVPQPGLFVERALPGSLMVNRRGERFVNEAKPYTEVIYAMYENHAQTGGCVPAWFIFDARFRRQYPAGPLLPGNIQPDRKLPQEWLGEVLYRADSLEELAARIGVDAEGLKRSVQRINRFAETGVDEDFGKGGNVFDRYYSDPSVKPNPCLGPLEKAPYYALRVDAGEIGTKGGLLTDEHARVLRESDRAPIAGLYATGNCSAAVMGRTYAGPGATLGPAMVFAYLAVADIVEAGSAGRKAA